MKIIIIKNDGKEIKSTNYFDSELNKHGKYYVSLNAGAFRLLIPDQYVNEIKQELRLAKKIVITRKALQIGGGLQGFEILLDDESDDPYTLQFSENSFDRLPEKTDENKYFAFSAWIRENKKVIKIYENKCYYTRK